MVKRHRPNLNDAASLLIRDVAERLEGFSHLRAEKILVVTGEARRASRASVKPLTFANGKSRDRAGRQKPIVRWNGKRMLYCITLRPLFFRSSTAEERVETLIHELFHIAPAFDGTLHPARRHAALGRKFQRKLRPLVRRYLSHCPREVLDILSYHGEVKVLQWLERPPARLGPGKGGVRRVYDEEQLFVANVRMLTSDRMGAEAP